MNERIVVNYDNLYTDIESILDEVRMIRSDKQFIHIMGDEVKKIKEWENSLRKRINEPFNAVIIGDFKRGKSTLVNALLGENIVPTNVLPETVTINKISYGESNCCTAILKNGKKAKLDIKELKRSEIERIISELPSEIEYVEVLSKNELLKQISIIDTPGIGDIFKQFDEQVTEYLKYADALIYVVSAKAPLSQTEQSFISAAVLPQSFSRIFVVVNMIDSLENSEDIEKVISLTRDRIESITPNASVYAVSALDEYCRIMNMSRPIEALNDYLENNFELFKTSLQRDIIMQKDIIKTMRVVSLAKFMLNDMTNRINLFLGIMTSNVSDLSLLEEQYNDQNSALMKKIQKEISSVSLDIDEMQYEANGWILDFMDRVKTEIKTMQGQTTTECLQKHFQFYMIDKIKASVIACTTEHQKQINNKLKEAAKAISLEVTATFGSVDSQIADSITDISWTNMDTAMFATDFILGSIEGLNLGPIVLIGQAIAGFIRQKEIGKRQKDYLEPVLQNFDSVIDEVQASVKAVYEKMKRSAVEKLNTIYNDQIEQSLSAIKQAQQILETEEIKRVNIISYLNDIMDSVNELKEELKKYE